VEKYLKMYVIKDLEGFRGCRGFRATNPGSGLFRILGWFWLLVLIAHIIK
jgi:hypothetical protein